MKTFPDLMESKSTEKVVVSFKIASLSLVRLRDPGKRAPLSLLLLSIPSCLILHPGSSSAKIKKKIKNKIEIFSETVSGFFFFTQALNPKVKKKTVDPNPNPNP